MSHRVCVRSTPYSCCVNDLTPRPVHDFLLRASLSPEPEVSFLICPFAGSIEEFQAALRRARIDFELER